MGFEDSKKENKTGKIPEDVKDTKDAKDAKDARDVKDAKEARDASDLSAFPLTMKAIQDLEDEPSSEEENCADDNQGEQLSKEDNGSGNKRKKTVPVIIGLIAAAAAVLVIFYTAGRGTAFGSALYKAVNGNAETAAEQHEGNGADSVPEEVSAKIITQEVPTTIGKAIHKNAVYCGDIRAIREDPSLRFDVEYDYGVKDVTKAITFDDDLWFTTESMETAHYTDELIGFTIRYFAALNERENHNDKAVLDMIVPESRLLGEVAAIKADPVIIHTIDELAIGELRRADDNFYLMVRLSTSTNDGSDPVKTTEVLRIITDHNEAKMAETAEVVQ